MSDPPRRVVDGGTLMGLVQRLPGTAVGLAGLFLAACVGKVGRSVGDTPPGGTLTGSGGASVPSGTGGAGGAGQPPVLSRVGLAARVSKIEYQNSVADVLGVTLLPAELDAAAGG